MRKKIIAGNWKMNNDLPETEKFINAFKEKNFDNKVDVVVCPPFTSLYMASKLLEGTNIKIGAQNMHFEDKGAFTGEVSAQMLKSIGIDYVILGHSERREYFFEDDEIINKKVLKALEKDLKPILCVGETLEETEANNHFNIVKNQLVKDLENVSIKNPEDLIIAYEPIWAIGTGKSASAEDAEEMCIYIRETLSQIFTKDLADKIRIQYGGSVKPETIKELMEKENIDGALVGGASLKVEDFFNISNYEVMNE